MHTPPSKADSKLRTKKQKKKKYTGGIRSKDLIVSHVSVAINVCKCNVFFAYSWGIKCIVSIYIYTHTYRVCYHVFSDTSCLLQLKHENEEIRMEAEKDMQASKKHVSILQKKYQRYF